MSNIEYDFNSYAIKSFKPGMTPIVNDEVGLKAHYTSPEAFLSIIDSGVIRFTDIRYMNDRTESIYFVKLLLDFMDEYGWRYPFTHQIINLLIDRNDFADIQSLNINVINYKEVENLRYNPSRHFLFCTSNDADSLNMWNYYVNNGHYQGYNIVINMDKFIKTFDTNDKTKMDPFLIHFGNVLYKEKRQYTEIESLVENLEERSKNVPNLDYLALKLRGYIDLQGVFYKHSKFESENEFRIVISISEKRIPHSEEEANGYFGENNKSIVEKFYTKNGLVIPYLSVKIPKDSISRITVSPITEFEIAKDSIRELLGVKGYSNVQIHKSKIPIRF